MPQLYIYIYTTAFQVHEKQALTQQNNKSDESYAKNWKPSESAEVPEMSGNNVNSDSRQIYANVCVPACRKKMKPLSW